MEKHLPASAGDTAVVPAPGRQNMLQSNEDHGPQLLSLCSVTREAAAMRSPHTTIKVQPCLLQEKAQHSNKDPAQPEVNKRKFGAKKRETLFF